jgi:hypothetical protein
MRLLAAVTCATLLICFGAAPSHAEKRVALVIGNGAYRNAPTLTNPRNDAEDVSAALKRAGFETITGIDLDKNGMDNATNRGLTREQMIQRMREAQDRLLREVWERRSPDLPLKTPEQLIVLASIVEKETGKPEERTRIAAVFANRLRQKMKLQSDPTVIYGLVAGKGSLGRSLSKSDLTQPTAYNTYVIDGLPPGPITTPGRSAIEAAANPARTKELYFVADGTGGHAFAETYE